MTHPTPRSVVLDLLSTLPRGSMPVRVLVEVAGVFGIAENGLRVALARLLAAGLVERDARGFYRLGTGAGAVARQVASWRRLEDRMRPWDGGWIGVHTGALGRSQRAQLRRRTRAFRLLGMRELESGLEVRPDNLAGGVAAVREQLYALGLEPAAPVFELRGFDDATAARAQRLWPVRTLLAEYRRLRTALERSERRLAALPEARAMAESFLLGGEAIRLLALDPLLPDAIVPGRERALLVAAMRRYDAAGRACWAGFLAQYGVLQARTPAHLGAGATAPAVAGGVA